jgi:hypothetical protein
LANVVVTMSDWACENGAGWNSASCTTTFGDTYQVPITLTLYDVSGTTLGSEIAADTQTFNIPYRPSASASCVGANVGGWSDGGTCVFGYASNITFDFSSQHLVLPSTFVYEISYNTNYNDPTDVGPTAAVNSLNVGLSDDTGHTATTNVTVGTDAITGDFLNSAEPQSYCNNSPADGIGVFQYDPYVAPCTGGNAVDNPAPGQAGSWAVDYQPGFWVPAVQFNAAGQEVEPLYPGATPLPVDFAVTNPGNGPVTISSVSFSITNIAGPNDALSGVTGDCPSSWFSLVQPTVPTNVVIGAGQTLYYDPSGGSIQLINETGNQDACEDATVTLGFTSS